MPRTHEHETAFKCDERRLTTQFEALVSQNRQLLSKPETALEVVRNWINSSEDLIKKSIFRLLLSPFRKLSEDHKKYIEKKWIAYLQSQIQPSIVANPSNISWGDEDEQVADEVVKQEALPETIDTLQLPHIDISFLYEPLQNHSSKGAACVPFASAYLHMLFLRTRPRYAFFRDHLIPGFLDDWRTKHKSEFVAPNIFYTPHERSDRLFNLKFLREYREITSIKQIDQLIHFFTAQKNSELRTSLDQIVDIKENSERGCVITISRQLSGRLVHVSEKNPFWSSSLNQDSAGVRMPIPKVGLEYTVPGQHALCVVDYDAENKEFYIIDPQSGSVLAVSVESLRELHENGTRHSMPGDFGSPIQVSIATV